MYGGAADVWVMTSFGILMPAIRPLKTVPAGDLRTLQIRARRAQDLDILRAQYMRGALGPNIFTPDKDYEYRAYCTPEAFGVALLQLVLDIDYLKFKPTTARYSDQNLHDCYNSIWNVVMHRFGRPLVQYQYPAVSKRSAGAGWPAGRAAMVGASDPVDRIDVLLDDWRHERLRADADRDSYEPEVWDDTEIAPLAQPLLAGNPEMDALYDELGAIETALRLSKPMDHQRCQHAQSDNARARCRRRRLRVNSQRAAELRKLIHDVWEAKSSVVVGSEADGR